MKDTILAYARRVNFTVEDLFVIDGSRRSSKSNAFFTGFGKHKRIALFDTLIAGHSVPELVAVLAHEIGHYKKQHVLRTTVLSIVHMGVMFFLLSVFLTHAGLFQAFYLHQPSVYAGREYLPGNRGTDYRLDEASPRPSAADRLAARKARRQRPPDEPPLADAEPPLSDADPAESPLSDADPGGSMTGDADPSSTLR